MITLPGRQPAKFLFVFISSARESLTRYRSIRSPGLEDPGSRWKYERIQRPAWSNFQTCNTGQMRVWIRAGNKGLPPPRFHNIQLRPRSQWWANWPVGRARSIRHRPWNSLKRSQSLRPADEIPRPSMPVVCWRLQTRWMPIDRDRNILLLISLYNDVRSFGLSPLVNNM